MVKMMKRIKQGNHNRGITLAELIAAGAVLSILAVTTVPSVVQARVRAKIVKATDDIRMLAVAQELYAMDNHGSYPPESEDHPYERGRMEAGIFFLTTPIAYIKSVPHDALTSQYRQFDSSLTPQVYETGVAVRASKFIAYVIFSVGPDEAENGISSPAPFYGIQRTGDGNTYSSSNGLRSAGDIYWYGGDCTVAKSLVIDGKTYNGRCPPRAWE